MNTINMQPTKTESVQAYRQTALNSLAVVGVIALILLGIWGAIYSSRFVPGAVNRIGSAAVYVGSLFVPAPTGPSDLSVVPNASSTVISFGTPAIAPATTTATSTTPTTKPKPTSYPTMVAAGGKTSTVVTMSGVGVAPALYGYPDLSVTVTAIGYLTTASTDAFVSSATVPSGDRPAVKFTVKNIGTNVSGAWRFSAAIPTRSSFTYKSDTQISLAPGESVDYTLGFDRAQSGDKQPITIATNYDRAVTEPNYSNNDISLNFNIK